MPKFVYIIALVVIVIIVSAIRLNIRSSNHHFICSECGENFQVSFVKYMFTSHSLDGKCNVKCPKCGKTNLLTPEKGEK